MVLDPLIGKPILDQIDRHAQDQLQQKLVDKTHPYWTRCPGCGRTVAKRELVSKGCFRCGWQGTEEDIMLATPKGPAEVATTTTLSEMKSMTLYKVDCPQCQTRVVREQLIDNGCYLCGWMPAQ